MNWIFRSFNKINLTQWKLCLFLRDLFPNCFFSTHSHQFAAFDSMFIVRTARFLFCSTWIRRICITNHTTIAVHRVAFRRQNSFDLNHKIKGNKIRLKSICSSERFEVKWRFFSIVFFYLFFFNLNRKFHILKFGNCFW